MMERRKNQRKIAFYHPEGNQLARSFFFLIMIASFIFIMTVTLYIPSKFSNKI